MNEDKVIFRRKDAKTKGSMGAQNLHVNWPMKSKLKLLYAAQST